LNNVFKTNGQLAECTRIVVMGGGDVRVRRVALRFLVGFFPEQAECSVCSETFNLPPLPETAQTATTLNALTVTTAQLPLPGGSSSDGGGDQEGVPDPDLEPTLPCVQRGYTDRFKKTVCKHVTCKGCLQGWVQSKLYVARCHIVFPPNIALEDVIGSRVCSLEALAYV
jgi:hypothetical protein